ncbi:MAG: hypothetical protein ACXVYV_07735 [Gaiellales bacterium]
MIVVEPVTSAARSTDFSCAAKHAETVFRRVAATDDRRQRQAKRQGTSFELLLARRIVAR